MFAYCGNNPVLLRDTTGTSSDGDLNLLDYIIIHILVQAYVATKYGLYPEVYVKGPLGRGFLDLYDKDSHSYYEVTSESNAKSSRKTAQIEKYKAANQMGLPVYSPISYIPKLKEGREPIDNYFVYGNYSIHYWLLEPGLIVYKPENVRQSQKHQANYFEPAYSSVPETSVETRQRIAVGFGFAIFGGVGVGGMLGMFDNMQMAR